MQKTKRTRTKKPKTDLAPICEPSAAEKKAIAKATARRELRDAPIKTGAELAGDALRIKPPHNDHLGWQIRLEDALGTRSAAFVNTEMLRLASFLQRNGEVNREEVDAVFAVLAGVKPENEIEAMLVIQMAITHALVMRSAAYLARSTEIHQQDSNALTLSRLSRNFTLQTEALAKLRRGGQQKVIVEHVHVYPGGQAIVGTISHPGGAGATCQNGGQPHALNYTAALAISEHAPMPSQNPERQAMPGGNSERQEALPDAWGGGGVGRSNGGAQRHV